MFAIRWEIQRCLLSNPHIWTLFSIVGCGTSIHFLLIFCRTMAMDSTLSFYIFELMYCFLLFLEWWQACCYCQGLEVISSAKTTLPSNNLHNFFLQVIQWLFLVPFMEFPPPHTHTSVEPFNCSVSGFFIVCS